MVRVLHITGALEIGGVETLLYNYYQKMDREQIKFDFVVFGNKKGAYEDNFKELGCNIYHIDPLNKFGLFKHLLQLKKIISKEEYQIIHVHRNLVSFIYLILGKLLKVPTRIGHCHGTINKNKMNTIRVFKNNIYSILNKKFATDYFACSKSAAEYMYGKESLRDVLIINNAIDLDKFKFNPIVRKSIKKEFGLEDSFVIGCVARFSEEKNHKFLIDIFCDFSKRYGETKLLLVGEGPLQEEIKEKVIENGLEEKVFFLGPRLDIANILHGIDLFILPSLNEGLGIALIEAQAVGIKCIASNNVPMEANVGSLVHYVSLEEGHKFWSDTIHNYIYKSEYNEIDPHHLIRGYGYDIDLEARKLEKFYLSSVCK